MFSSESENSHESSINEGENKKEGEKGKIELRFAEIYQSPEWKALTPLDRAQLILVAEGVKPGVFVGGDFTNFQKIVQKMGLEARLNTYPLLLNPVYTISTPEGLSEYYRETVSATGITAENFYRINGKFLGYPSCCVEEYTNPQKNLEERKKYPPNISNFDYEMIQMREKGVEYPEELDYCPPTFTPCSAHCAKALGKLREWKGVMQEADPEAAYWLRLFQWAFEPYRKFHEKELKRMEKDEELEDNIAFLRKSILGSSFEKEKGRINIEMRAREDLEGLGLKWEHLQGKRILDIGAGLAEVAQAAKTRGIEVLSLDKNLKRWKEEELIEKDISYIVGKAEMLPFKAESFDLVIAHAAPPLLSEDKEEVKKVIKEVERVLKEGGEFRFGPAPLAYNVFNPRELFTEEEERSFTKEQVDARVKEKSLEFLKSTNPAITEQLKEDAHFYVLKKQRNNRDTTFNE
ncbi:MAG: DUF483 domain-containing protein [Candidatus Portnoybacteria bacterium]|nr:DUF483 domain-containing protein [Candidatus Portnoybacteria bacterium]